MDVRLQLLIVNDPEERKRFKAGHGWIFFLACAFDNAFDLARATAEERKQKRGFPQRRTFQNVGLITFDGHLEELPLARAETA